jgi:hypothetical protein
MAIGYASMNAEEQVRARAEAAIAFDRHLQRADGQRVAGILIDGYNTLRELFLARVSIDPEREIGMDSMLSPVSMLKAEARAKIEIDIFMVAEACDAARERRLVAEIEGWFQPWLMRLRLGEFGENDAVGQRLEHYRGCAADDRRKAFVMVLERTMPSARQAPLVVYRLLPIAVSIATAMAFGDLASAAEGRKRQIALLPGIADCHACRGGLLETGEKCHNCGNPMWKYEWLTAD